MAAECCAGAVIRMLVVAHRVPCRQSVRHSSSPSCGYLAVIPIPGLPKWGMYRRTGAEPALPEPQNCIKRRACAPGQRRAEPHLLCGGQSAECLADLLGAARLSDIRQFRLFLAHDVRNLLQNLSFGVSEAANPALAGPYMRLGGQRRDIQNARHSSLSGCWCANPPLVEAQVRWRGLGLSKTISWKALGGSLSCLGGSWRA